MDQDTPAAHEDLYQEVMQSANKKGRFTVITDEDHPDMEFAVEPADKAIKNKMRRLMPSGLLDGIELPDDVNSIEEMEDINTDQIDLSKVDLNKMMLSEEATEEWLDEIAAHYSHDYYSPSEIRDLFDKFPDEYFVSAGTYLMELGESMDVVKDFRQG